jgi:hypothetical protein
MTTNTRVLHGVDAALRGLVQRAIDDSGLGPVVVVGTPAELPEVPGGGTQDGAAGLLGLLVHRITPAPSAPRTQPVRTHAPPSLEVDLHYLLSAESPVAGLAVQLMACTMNALHLDPVLTVIPTAGPSGPAGDPSPGETLTVRVDGEALGSAELTSLWSAFRRPWRLSAAYVVRGVRL